MTLPLPREEALGTIKSQPTCSVWVWRSHYGLTDPTQFTSSMDSTRSGNGQPGVINRTPTVKPALHSSSGKEKKKGRTEEKGIGSKLLMGKFLTACVGIKGRRSTRHVRRGSLKPKAGSKKKGEQKKKREMGIRVGWQISATSFFFFLNRLTGHETKLSKLSFFFSGSLNYLDICLSVVILHLVTQHLDDKMH